MMIATVDKFAQLPKGDRVYAAMVSELDDAIGRIVAALQGVTLLADDRALRRMLTCRTPSR